MAQGTNPHQKAVRNAQQIIFNKLCVAYRRSRQNTEFRLPAENVRSELNIETSIFVEALDSFIDAKGERIVVIFEQNGEKFITLGESAKTNVSD
jgi:hypothetical protein